MAADHEYADIDGSVFLVKGGPCRACQTSWRKEHEGLEQSSGTLVVKGLNPRTTAWELRQTYENHGLVDEIWMSGDGVAVIRYYSRDRAEHACQETHQREGPLQAMLSVDLDASKPSHRTTALFGTRLYFGNMVKEKLIETYKELKQLRKANSLLVQHDYEEDCDALTRGVVGCLFLLTQRMLRITFTKDYRCYRLEWPFKHVQLRVLLVPASAPDQDDDIHLVILFSRAPRLSYRDVGDGFRHLSPDESDRPDESPNNRVDFSRMTDPWIISTTTTTGHDGYQPPGGFDQTRGPKKPRGNMGASSSSSSRPSGRPDDGVWGSDWGDDAHPAAGKGKGKGKGGKWGDGVTVHPCTKDVTALEASWCITVVCPKRHAHFEQNIAPSLMKAGLLPTSDNGSGGIASCPYEDIRYVHLHQDRPTFLPRAEQEDLPPDAPPLQIPSVNDIFTGIDRVSMELLTSGEHGFLLFASYQVLVTNGLLQGSNALDPSFVNDCLLAAQLDPMVKIYCLTAMEKIGQPIMNPKQEFERIAARGQRQLGLVHTLMDYPEHCMRILHVDVTPLKMYVRGPFVEQSNRVLRRFRDKTDNFLRVAFVEEDCDRLFYEASLDEVVTHRMKKVLDDGISLACLPPYELLAYSSSQLRNCGCWMFRPDEQLEFVYIESFMGDFTSIDMPGKYAARQGQCFSATRQAIRIAPEEWVVEKDITAPIDPDDPDRGDYEFTDGCGYCDRSVAKEVATELKIDYVPCAFQIRFNGVKGMIVLDPSFRQKHPEPVRMAVRQSQLKFKAHHDQLETCDHARFIPLHLNREVITLLLTRAVKPEVFHQLKDEMLTDIRQALDDNGAALRMLAHLGRDHFFLALLGDFLRQGFNVSDEPFLRACLSEIRRFTVKDILAKTHLYVEQGAVLHGVSDESEARVLEEGQVHVRVKDPDGHEHTITGRVNVSKNPCFDPGDTRVFEAVDRPELRHCVNVIVFPVKGSRPHPNELSGSDLDGDQYHVIWDQRLIPPTPNPPGAEYYKPRPKGRAAGRDDNPLENPAERQRLLKEYFINYFCSDNLGKIAVAWLNMVYQPQIYAELKANDPACLRLAALHAEAVDSAKTGRCVKLPVEWTAKDRADFLAEPIHWERGRVFPSISVCGEIYREMLYLADTVDNAISDAGHRPVRPEVAPEPWLVRDPATQRPVARGVLLSWRIPFGLAQRAVGHRILIRGLIDGQHPRHPSNSHMFSNLYQCNAPFEELVYNTRRSDAREELSIPLTMETVQFQVQVWLREGGLSDTSVASEPLQIAVEDEFRHAEACDRQRDHLFVSHIPVDNGPIVLEEILEKEFRRKLDLPLNRGDNIIPTHQVTRCWGYPREVSPGHVSECWSAQVPVSSPEVAAELIRRIPGGKLQIKWKSTGRKATVRVSLEEDSLIKSYGTCLMREKNSKNFDKDLVGGPDIGRVRRITPLAPEDGFNRARLCEQLRLIVKWIRSKDLAFVDLLIRRAGPNQSYLDILFQTVKAAACFDVCWSELKARSDATADEKTLQAFDVKEPTDARGAPRTSTDSDSRSFFFDAISQMEHFYNKTFAVTVEHCSLDKDELRRTLTRYLHLHGITREHTPISGIDRRRTDQRSSLGGRPAITPFQPEASDQRHVYDVRFTSLQASLFFCELYQVTDFYVKRPTPLTRRRPPPRPPTRTQRPSHVSSAPSSNSLSQRTPDDSAGRMGDADVSDNTSEAMSSPPEQRDATTPTPDITIPDPPAAAACAGPATYLLRRDQPSAAAIVSWMKNRVRARMSGRQEHDDDDTPMVYVDGAQMRMPRDVFFETVEQPPPATESPDRPQTDALGGGGDEGDQEDDADADADEWRWPENEPMPPGVVDPDVLHKDAMDHVDEMRMECNRWRQKVVHLMQQYGIAEESELLTGCITHVHGRQKKDRDLSSKLSYALRAEVDATKRRLFDDGGDIGASDEERQRANERMLVRASAAFIAAYHPRPHRVDANIPRSTSDTSEPTAGDRSHTFRSFPWVFFGDSLKVLKQRYRNFYRHNPNAFRPPPSECIRDDEAMSAFEPDEELPERSPAPLFGSYCSAFERDRLSDRVQRLSLEQQTPSPPIPRGPPGNSRPPLPPRVLSEDAPDNGPSPAPKAVPSASRATPPLIIRVDQAAARRIVRHSLGQQGRAAGVSAAAGGSGLDSSPSPQPKAKAEARPAPSSFDMAASPPAGYLSVSPDQPTAGPAAPCTANYESLDDVWEVYSNAAVGREPAPQMVRDMPEVRDLGEMPEMPFQGPSPPAQGQGGPPSAVNTDELESVSVVAERGAAAQLTQPTGPTATRRAPERDREPGPADGRRLNDRHDHFYLRSHGSQRHDWESPERSVVSRSDMPPEDTRAQARREQGPVEDTRAYGRRQRESPHDRDRDRERRDERERDYDRHDNSRRDDVRERGYDRDPPYQPREPMDRRRAGYRNRELPGDEYRMGGGRVEDRREQDRRSRDYYDDRDARPSRGSDHRERPANPLLDPPAIHRPDPPPVLGRRDSAGSSFSRHSRQDSQPLETAYHRELLLDQLRNLRSGPQNSAVVEQIHKLNAMLGMVDRTLSLIESPPNQDSDDSPSSSYSPIPPLLPPPRRSNEARSAHTHRSSERRHEVRHPQQDYQPGPPEDTYEARTNVSRAGRDMVDPELGERGRRDVPAGAPRDRETRSHYGGPDEHPSWGGDDQEERLRRLEEPIELYAPPPCRQPVQDRDVRRRHTPDRDLRGNRDRRYRQRDGWERDGGYRDGSYHGRR
ncbi:unnamed protein product [Vitrella brassicaformis CCMP3155]|uniref:RNA-directed RNA polymerase n=3 Tax=Vitrella brassicaformis TaxID=1169539 RepID=A0A0G4EIH3_VITBC|nr:unnamed protein product [Vitrella brassicaformis CCMP3155]|eukprot:CEL96798.1 unnamed protein product [Vitrella brassicaformis CCMP3155]